MGRLSDRWVVLAAALILSAPLRAFCAEEPNLKTIAQRLQQWRSSFVNVRLTWESWDANLVKAKGALRPSPDDRFNRTEWIWSDVGAVRHEFWMHSKGHVVGHGWWGVDGRKLLAFRASFRGKGGKPDFLDDLLLDRTPSPQPASTLMVMPMLGLYGNDATWLCDRFKRGNAKLEKHADFESARCARVAFGNEILWLDSGNDFLVKGIVWPTSDNQTRIIFQVDEFQRVGAVRFPKRGWFRGSPPPNDEKTCWLVTDVALNQSLAPNVFDPPAPQVGTVVTDGRNRTAYIFGEKRHGDIREQQIAEEAEKNLPASGPTATAQVPRSRVLFWSGCLLLISVALLVSGVWIMWRRGS